MPGKQRGIKPIINATLATRCPISFEMQPKTMIDTNDEIITVIIINGKAEIIPPSEPEQIYFDKIVDLENKTIEGDDIDDYVAEIAGIAEFLRSTIAALYEIQIMEIKLQFGIIEEEHLLYLIDGSVKTSFNIYADNVFGNDELFVDFMIEFMSRKQTSKCFTNYSDCLKPKYKVQKLIVMLYHAQQLYPNILPSNLHKIIKTRIKKFNPDILKQKVNVCITCCHMYSAEKRIHQGSKLTVKLPVKDNPVFFESLFQTQQKVYGEKSALILTREDPLTKPQAFAITLAENPYGEACIEWPKPPIPPPKQVIGYIPRPNYITRRLCSENAMREVAPDIPEHKFRKNPPLPNIPKTKTRASYSQKKAPKLYSKQPFSYSFLNSDNIKRHK